MDILQNKGEENKDTPRKLLFESGYLKLHQAISNFVIISEYNDTRPSFQALNMVLWQVSIVTMALVVWGTHGIQVKVGERGWPFALIIPTEIPYATGIIYNCFQRVGWSLSLSWIIFSCTKGYGGNVNLRIISLMILFRSSDFFLFSI